jgi:hypothetical protein
VKAGRTTPAASRAAATRRAARSFHGAAISCTPTGNAPGRTTGTDTIGSPMKDSGCAKMPIMGRVGTSAPSNTPIS